MPNSISQTPATVVIYCGNQVRPRRLVLYNKSGPSATTLMAHSFFGTVKLIRPDSPPPRYRQCARAMSPFARTDHGLAESVECPLMPFLETREVGRVAIAKAYQLHGSLRRGSKGSELIDTVLLIQ